ncbi:DEAD/DEAH box helicase family protein [Endozoicomonas euniceicola]|uniref:DEAD/DEAH box helicase family protein n=1 Tax=Endozoicomonas euniceicola TaxID=1234143 RepID=A0ABY6GUU1_9GAMM|nr:DEAD/DEAH box helicase family protein [Endozoicomonas euniceicola]UYM16352.1 DEAD/DEAH box helicase family protein [Endozoicomonas euniceicola]
MEQSIQTKSETLLISGGHNDPLLPKLIDAINRARVIDITVAFIRVSGLKLLFGALCDALERGAELRILTSDYMDVTDPQALRELMLLKDRKADIRIYENDGQQSFHMKSYIFIRTHDNNFIEGCAFVGSSNISKAALTSGHEWNLQVECSAPIETSEARQFQAIRKEFQSIFQHELVHELDHIWIDEYIKRRKTTQLVAVDSEQPFELPSPTDIQLEALQALQASRQKGYQRGLVVLATGLGKTWLAAFDSEQSNSNRVLFVAHREEILIQAQRTFVQIRPNAKNGFYNSKQKVKDSEADIVFASVQTLGRREHFEGFDPEHFDYIVIDEFHHADAPTYRNVIRHFKPKFMLGLTATPERTDQADILSLCDNNLVFERNLIDGINQKLLAPFKYFGIHDKFVNYDEIPWRSGKFVIKELENAFATHQRAKHILTHWLELKQQRTLAFCVSKAHADFMANYFHKAGHKAAAVYSGSIMRRHEALNKLEQSDLDILFSVDLFNEGTDLPAIDTVLMLRPTESKILFLQQLGRGLRLHHQKEYLAVIDLIGNHKSFLIKPVVLHNVHSAKEAAHQVASGNGQLPDGCFVNYDPEVINLLEKMTRPPKDTTLKQKTIRRRNSIPDRRSKRQQDKIADEYQSLKTLHGYRPTATEFYHYLNEINKPFKVVGEQFGSWFDLLATQDDLSQAESKVVQKHGHSLLKQVETASMTKCFKMILLSAFLELDGFERPPTTRQLAETSWHILKRQPELFAREIPASKKDLKPDSNGWHSYWKGNPIKYFSNKEDDPFRLEEGNFICKETVTPEAVVTVHEMLQELVDLRLEEYSCQYKPS